MDNMIMQQKKFLENQENNAYLIFRIGLSLILTAASVQVSVEQNAAGISGIVSPSFFFGLIAAVSNFVMAVIILISKSTNSLAKALPRPVLAIIDITLITISTSALVLSAVSVNSMIDQQSKAMSRNIVMVVVDAILLALDIFQLARDLIRASGEGPQNLNLGVTAPGQAGEEVEMDLLGEDPGDGEGEGQED